MSRCEMFVMCGNQATMRVITPFGVIPACARCVAVTQGRNADTTCQHVALCETNEECKRKGAE